MSVHPGSLLAAIKRAKRVYIIGNGGSYANAAHWANDLLSVGVKAYTLDAATLTAWANDHGYANVFALWIEKVGEKGDLLIALSGSGTSQNILTALRAAERVGMMHCTVSHYLRDGWDMQKSEEDQIEIAHEIMRALK